MSSSRIPALICGPLFDLTPDFHPPTRPGRAAAGPGPHGYFFPVPRKNTVKELLLMKRQVGHTQRCASDSLNSLSCQHKGGGKSNINHRALPLSEKQLLPGGEHGQQRPASVGPSLVPGSPASELGDGASGREHFVPVADSARAAEGGGSAARAAQRAGRRRRHVRTIDKAEIC